MTKDDLIKEYKKVAKYADSKLRAIEKLSLQKGYENVKQYAYGSAMRDIEQYFGEGATRFDKRLPQGMPAQSIQARIEAAKRLINAPTASKSRISKLYRNRAETLNKRYGTNFTWEDLRAFFEDRTYKKLADQYGSKTLLRVIGKKQENFANIIESIKKAKHRRNVPAHMVNKEILKELKQNGITIKDL